MKPSKRCDRKSGAVCRWRAITAQGLPETYEGLGLRIYARRGLDRDDLQQRRSGGCRSRLRSLPGRRQRPSWIAPSRILQCSHSPLQTAMEEFPVWAPDGNRIAYLAVGDGQAQVRIRNIADGSDDLLVDGIAEPVSWSVGWPVCRHNARRRKVERAFRHRRCER